MIHLFIWKGANEDNRPDDIADEIEPYRTGHDRAGCGFGVMMLAEDGCRKGVDIGYWCRPGDKCSLDETSLAILQQRLLADWQSIRMSVTLRDGRIP